MSKSTKLVQIDIPVSNLQKSMDFFHEIMGWVEVPIEIYERKIIEVPEGNGFGISLVLKTTSQKIEAQGPILYFLAYDFKKQVDMIVNKYPTHVFQNPTDFPGVGRVFVFSDLDGTLIGLVERAES